MIPYIECMGDIDTNYRAVVADGTKKRELCDHEASDPSISYFLCLSVPRSSLCPNACHTPHHYTRYLQWPESSLSYNMGPGAFRFRCRPISLSAGRPGSWAEEQGAGEQRGRQASGQLSRRVAGLAVILPIYIAVGLILDHDIALSVLTRKYTFETFHRYPSF
jgi:hypothetical protein